MRSRYLLMTAALLTLSLPAAAQETGHYHGLGVLVSTEKTVVKLDDQPNHVVAVIDEDGAIHNVDGKPFPRQSALSSAGLDRYCGRQTWL